MIVLWILLGIVLLLILISLVTFFAVCGRKDIPWENHAAMVKTVGESYANLIQGGVDWLRAQNPRELTLTSYDGLRLHACWIPAEKARGTIVFFHGWHSSIVGDFSPSMPQYHDMGFNLLLTDQRAQNGSEGRFITFGIRESRDVAPWVELHNRTFGACPVFLAGLSMGATTVLMAAGEKLPDNVRGIIADCGFTSPWEIMADVARTRAHLPAFPLLYLVNFWCRTLGGFDARENSTVRAMEKNCLPVFLAHGEADNFVPCRMSREAYDAARCPKTLLTVPGAGHGRSYLVQKERYINMLSEFLRSNLEREEAHRL